MFSIQKDRKVRQERNSQFSKKYEKSTDIEPLQRLRERFFRDTHSLALKKGPNQTHSKGFRKSQYNQPNRKSQIRVHNKKTTIQRKSVMRMGRTQQSNTFYYFIKNEGNNSDRVCQILNSRGNWLKCLSKNNQNQVNFYWNSLNKSNSESKHNFSLFGRISGSYELTDKARLYDNIVNYCAKNQISNERFLPVTFCFTSKQLNSQIETNVQQFLEYFQHIQNRTSLTNSWILKPTNLNRGRDIFLFNSLEKLFSLLYVGNTFVDDFSRDKKLEIKKLKIYKSTHEIQSQKYEKPSYKLIHQIQSKLHFSKDPANQFKRAQSMNKKIPIFQLHSEHDIKSTKNSFHQPINSIQFIKKTNQQFFRTRQKSLKLKTQVIQNKEQRKSYQLTNPNHKKLKSNQIESASKLGFQLNGIQPSKLQQRLSKTIINLVQGKSSYGQKLLKRQIVIQKYIENPFLINGNKFDIRIWVLVDQQSNFYIFKSGYLRFSSEKYKLDENSIGNNFIHLTNHAVQKNSDKYQKNTNIVKMSYLKEYLQQNYHKNITKNYAQKYQEILKEIQRIITISLEATLGHFFKQQHNRKKYHFNCQFQLFGYDFLLDRELNVRLIQANCNPSITQDNLYLQQAVPRMLNDLFKLTVDKIFLPKQSPKQIFHMDGFSIQNMWKKIGKIGQTNTKQIKHSYQ